MNHHLSIEIERLEEGIYLASCPVIQGCHAEGRTIGEALDNLQSVAQVIYELCQEKGLPFITEFPDVPIEKVIWQVEFSPALEVTR
jgi:predicted RNase H-like HicB family nuclease